MGAKPFQSMHTATNYYLFTLAISDLIILLLGKFLKNYPRPCTSASAVQNCRPLVSKDLYYCKVRASKDLGRTARKVLPKPISYCGNFQQGPFISSKGTYKYSGKQGWPGVRFIQILGRNPKCGNLNFRRASATLKFIEVHLPCTFVLALDILGSVFLRVRVV